MRSFVKNFIVVLLLLTGTSTFAATVDTVAVYSASMRKNCKAVIVRPAVTGADTRVPVVYLLHGYSGNQGDWIKKVPAIMQYADQYRLMIVCPDGGFSSWYFDSPVDSSFRYETFVSSELVNWVDSHYATIASRSGRGITGLSMGGHGALYLAIRHPDVFGTAGSMSGGVDLVPFPGNWDIAKRLGEYATHSDRWEERSVVNMVHLIRPGTLALIFDCGTDDFFYKVNVKLHEEMLYRNIAHDFISRPGGHSWEYWSNAVGYQLQFMSKFFTNAPKAN